MKADQDTRIRNRSVLGEFFFGRPRSPWLRAVRVLPAIGLAAWILHTASVGRPPGLQILRLVVNPTNTVTYGLHSLVYVIFALAVVWALRPNFRSLRWSLLLGWALSTICGVVDELIQISTPNRTGSFQDAVADSCGAFVACALVLGVGTVARWRRGGAARAAGSPEGPAEATVMEPGPAD